jgi:hypothetical protein
MINLAHDPGGKTTLALPLWVRGAAVFDGPGDMYRYELSRVWDESKPVLFVIGMNPSTANSAFDDPTLYKVRHYAESWGYGTLLMGNVFAYRATDKKRLLEVSDPVGPENDQYLLDMADRAKLILFAYGSPHKSLLYRGPEVARLLARKHARKLHVLELSKSGVPKHPLYLKSMLKPVLWKPE